MELDEIITKALQEDLGEGDHTSLSTIPEGQPGKARLLIKAPGVLAGVTVADAIFRKVDPSLKMKVLIPDGSEVEPGHVAFTVEGPVRAILASERLVLNFMQRLSGIATYTRSLVRLTEGYKARLLDTRKTTPLLRGLEKYAVRMGGGFNHRMGLYDMIMIKDNHVDYAGGIPEAIRAVKDYLGRTGKNLKVEIEVRNMEELNQVLSNGGVDRIMLDNFTPPLLQAAVSLISGRYETEASGGIHAGNIREYAATGVDFISVGALTHHIQSLDMSLKACKAN